MTTPTRISDGRELVAQVTRVCDDVIAAERSRLERRRPQLSAAELAAVDETLSDLVDRLLLDALRGNPDLHESIAPLFTTDRGTDKRKAHS